MRITSDGATAAVPDRGLVRAGVDRVLAGVGPRARSALWCGAVAAIALVLARVDPSETHVFGRCPTLWLTGLLCGGCGALRALHALLGGDVAQAVAYNLLVVVTVPVIAIGTLASAYHALTGRRVRQRPRVVAPFGRALLLALIAYTVVRNVPFAALDFARPHPVSLHPVSLQGGAGPSTVSTPISG